MSENTKIEWADHTFNPWVGCTKVSPACDHCYAEGWAKRTGQSELWAGERRRTTPLNWKQPLKWNRGHEEFFREYGHRQRVFAASLADIFDNQVPDDWREDFWQLVHDTPNLDWMLLTKRPQNIRKMLPSDWGQGYPNVWLGTTVEDQKRANIRVWQLLNVPTIVHFLSMEPLLGLTTLTYLPVPHPTYAGVTAYWDALIGRIYDASGTAIQDTRRLSQIITGGESGPHARPSHPDWFRSLRDQCQAAGVAFHFKQWGEWVPDLEVIPTSRNMDRIGWFTSDGFAPHDVGAGYNGEEFIHRVGKKAAGRLLDGREWDEFPEVSR